MIYKQNFLIYIKSTKLPFTGTFPISSQKQGCNRKYLYSKRDIFLIEFLVLVIEPVNKYINSSNEIMFERQ